MPCEFANPQTFIAVSSMTSESPHGQKERRSGTDRRQFSYAAHIPERRSGKERRRAPTSRKPKRTAESHPTPP